MSGAQGVRRAPESPAVPGPCLWAGPVRPHRVTTGLLPAQARRASGRAGSRRGWQQARAGAGAVGGAGAHVSARWRGVVRARAGCGSGGRCARRAPSQRGCRPDTPADAPSRRGRRRARRGPLPARPPVPPPRRPHQFIRDSIFISANKCKTLAKKLPPPHSELQHSFSLTTACATLQLENLPAQNSSPQTHANNARGKRTVSLARNVSSAPVEKFTRISTSSAKTARVLNFQIEATIVIRSSALVQLSLRAHRVTIHTPACCVNLVRKAFTP